jgi:hypothetical protein
MLFGGAVDGASVFGLQHPMGGEEREETLPIPRLHLHTGKRLRESGNERKAVIFSSTMYNMNRTTDIRNP